MTEVEVSITVNGACRTLRIDPRMSLLDLLRERLGLAFIRHDAFQCGYCTPGQLCSAAGLLTEPGPSAITDDLTADPPLTPGEIRERTSGNLCRCGGFVRRDLPITRPRSSSDRIASKGGGIMPRSRRRGLARAGELPGTLKRSSKDAQETFTKAHDNAVQAYGEGDQADRATYKEFKRKFEKRGDHWIPKQKPVPET